MIIFHTVSYSCVPVSTNGCWCIRGVDHLPLYGLHLARHSARLVKVSQPYFPAHTLQQDFHRLGGVVFTLTYVHTPFLYTTWHAEMASASDSTQDQEEALFSKNGPVINQNPEESVEAEGLPLGGAVEGRSKDRDAKRSGREKRKMRRLKNEPRSNTGV